jgi:hypothetical protein
MYKMQSYLKELPVSVEFYGDELMPTAIVIRANEKVEGIKFYSPESYSQQLGLMTRPEGYVVPAHVHNLVERTIRHTQEVLLIRKGSCSVTLFDEKNVQTSLITLMTGDVILLAHGGHEIVMNTECEILEVKQGPYAGPNDKTHLEIHK